MHRHKAYDMLICILLLLAAVDIARAQSPQGGIRRLPLDEKATYLNPTWSPDVKKLAYERIDGSEKFLRIHDFALGKNYRVEVDPFDQLAHNIAWYPDGERYIYAATGGLGNFDLYLFNGKTVRMTTADRDDDYPNLAPGGRGLVYSSNNRIHYSKGGTEGEALLSRSRSYLMELYPVFSPVDPLRIAFCYRQHGNEDIAVIDHVRNPKVRILTAGKRWNGSNDSYPSWSPDGRKIAFYSKREEFGPSEIIVMNADRSRFPGGANFRVVVAKVSKDEDDDISGPIWLSDGMILYVKDSARENNPICIVDVNDPEERWKLETGTIWNSYIDIVTVGGKTKIAFSAKDSRRGIWSNIYYGDLSIIGKSKTSD